MYIFICSFIITFIVFEIWFKFTAKYTEIVSAKNTLIAIETYVLLHIFATTQA